MSKQIHDEAEREQHRSTQVRFRCPEDLLTAFDQWVDESDHDSRSEAIRASMQQCVGASPSEFAPKRPPSEEPHATAYLRLVNLANSSGIIDHELAVADLSSALGQQAKVVDRMVLQQLRRDDYLIHLGNIWGERAWKLAGWEGYHG